MNSKAEWGANTIPRQTATFRDAEWEDKQGDKPKPPTNTQPDSQQDESKRLIAPTYFEGQYAQRKKRQRIEREYQKTGHDQAKPCLFVVTFFSASYVIIFLDTACKWRRKQSELMLTLTLPMLILILTFFDPSRISINSFQDRRRSLVEVLTSH